MIDPETINKALSTMEREAPAVYSNPNSASNNRRNSLDGKDPTTDKDSDGDDNRAVDKNEMGKSANVAAWRAPRIYSSNPGSAANSRKNSLSEKLNGKITRGMVNKMGNNENKEQEITKESIENALTLTNVFSINKFNK